MVAKTPPTKQRRAMVALNPNQVRETLKKVDQCMARLQELQYTVTGGSKVVSGVSLSPRSTRAYFRTSLRCKQETVRMKGTPAKRSPTGKFQGCKTKSGDWRSTSLPAMLLGETVVEILEASQFAKRLVATAETLSKTKTSMAPKTPNQAKLNPIMAQNHTPLGARRTKEKQNPQKRGTRCESRSPPVRVRARSKIQFKSISPTPSRPSTLANRVSPKSRPWAKKTVLFPNPTFMQSVPATGASWQSSHRTRSPIIPKTTKVQIPHKFVIKSPSKCLSTQLKYQRALPVPAVKSPVRKVEPVKPRRCSFSPVKMVSRLVSPLKSRISPRKSFAGVMSGLKQRPDSGSILRPSTSKRMRN